jgi:flagellar M-ring protein FliF
MIQFTKDDVMYIIELGVMMLLGLVVMFMVIRPLVKKILASEEMKTLTAPVPALAVETLAPAVSAQQTAHLIDVAQVQGQVHAQSVHRVGELADRNPSEAAGIIRQWLAEPQA